MQEIPVSELMTHDVELIDPGTSVCEVIHRMHIHHHSCALVGRNRVPRGIITERDLVKLLDRIINEADLADHTAEEIMSRPLHTVSISQSLFDALVISRAERIRHLPVVDAGQKLAGVVTYTDLADAHFHVIELQRAIIEHAVESRTEELRKANQELRKLSLENALLGIGNRRSNVFEQFVLRCGTYCQRVAAQTGASGIGPYSTRVHAEQATCRPPGTISADISTDRITKSSLGWHILPN